MQVFGFYGILVKREPLCKSYFDIYRLECPILFFGIDYFWVIMWGLLYLATNQGKIRKPESQLCRCLCFRHTTKHLNYSCTSMLSPFLSGGLQANSSRPLLFTRFRPLAMSNSPCTSSSRTQACRYPFRCAALASAYRTESSESIIILGLCPFATPLFPRARMVTEILQPIMVSVGRSKTLPEA